MTPTGFENDYTFTDSRNLSPDLWEEWLHTQLIMLAREMGMTDIVYGEVFNALSEEKRSELIGRKADFARMAGISL